MDKEKESFKFDWQRAFMGFELIMEQHLGRELSPSEKIMPTTKHVLHALCAHMDLSGFCYPSAETLAKETGLGIRSIYMHIGKAVKGGWLKQNKNTRPFSGQKWKNNTYQAKIPSKITKVRHEMPILQNGSASDDKGYASNCKKDRQEMPNNNNRIIKNNKDDDLVQNLSGFLDGSSKDNITTEQFTKLKQLCKHNLLKTIR